MIIVQKIERKAAKQRREREMVPSSDDPREELRALVRRHAAQTKAAVALHHMRSDRKNRTTGETIPCNLDLDTRVEIEKAEKQAKRDATLLESKMLRQLKHIPIFTQFLRNVYGCGVVVAAYLCAEIDIHKAVKPSNLRRYCGMAVINGRLERRQSGVKSAFNSSMRTRIFQMFSAMARNAARKTADRPNGTTSKYLDTWSDTKHREIRSARVVDGKLTTDDGKTVSAKGFAHSKGWHKAADRFLEDLYVVWRAIEGLPVWCGYYEAKLGVKHGGELVRRPGENVPQMLTVEEALAIVGDVGGRPAAVPVEFQEPEIDDEEATDEVNVAFTGEAE